MANLDIKASFLHGPELKFLTKALKGNRAYAIGCAVEFWELAAEYWARGGQLIPKSAFDALDLPEALLAPEVGLGEWRDGRIYARGSEEHFGWLKNRREAGRLGGLASAAKRKHEANKIKDEHEANGASKPSKPKLPIPIPIPIPVEEVVGSDADPPTPKGKKLPRLAMIWNLYRAPCMSEVLSCGSERQKRAATRWKENPDESFWISVMKKAAAAPLATGKGSSGWVMDFDFFLKPETANRIQEGKYDLKFQNQGGAKRSAFAEMEAQRAPDQK